MRSASRTRASAPVAVLAADGGYSKTDVVLVTATGDVLGAARGPAFSYRASHTAPSIDALAATVAAVYAEAGLDDARAPAEVGVFCLAGADFPNDYRQLRRAVTERGWSQSNLVLNDTDAVLRAGTDRGWGVALVCGTGINCLGVAPNGRMVRFPAQGWISGDWGGGYSVGQEALAAAVRGRDGRGPRTMLEHLVPEHFGLIRPRALVEAIYAGRLDKDRVSELAPIVFAAAGTGDPVARSIIDRLAMEIVAMAGAVIRRLRLVRKDVEVVLGGGIFRNEDATFVDRIREGVGLIAPRAQLSVLLTPPVVGAALRGLDELGAPSKAHERVRTSVTHGRLVSSGRGVGSGPR